MSSSEHEKHTGGCACGAVRYEVHGSLRPVVACHCETCRRTSGHHVAATQAAWGDLRLTSERGLAWYQSSDAARRGFCRECGGNLFFRLNDGPRVAITAGTLDSPTGLRMASHIFVAEAGDYYTLDPALPQHAGGTADE